MINSMENKNKNINLEIGDDLIITLKNFYDVGTPEYINLIEIDSSKFYVIKEDKPELINSYKDYTMGIILDKDDFIPSGTSLRILPIGHRSRRQGCSAKIKKKRGIYKKFKQPDFRICRKDRRTNTNEAYPLKMLARIISIDQKKKYIDLSIGKFYKLM